MSVVLFRRPTRWLASFALLFALHAQAAEVDVIDAGEGPKATLRSHPAVGSTERFELELDMLMKMDMGEMGQLPTDLPPLGMELEAKINQVDANGDIHYNYTLVDVSIKGKDIDPMMRAALEKQLPSLKGATGSHIVTARGVVKKSEFKPPAGADPQQLGNLQKGMNHATAVFPEQAIGVGARWRVRQEVKDNGLDLQQTIVYTLKERNGDHVVLTTELVQQPGENTHFAANLQGASAELVKFQSMGDGTTTIDLDHLYPTEGSLKHYLNTVMAVTQPGGKMNVGVEMNMLVTMKRK